MTEVNDHTVTSSLFICRVSKLECVSIVDRVTSEDLPMPRCFVVCARAMAGLCTRVLLIFGVVVGLASAWAPPAGALVTRAARRAALPTCNAPTQPPDLEEVTEKYGLEAGLFSALKRGTSGDSDGEKPAGMAKAGDLLKRYGGAYLLTSTSLALVSFSICCVPPARLNIISSTRPHDRELAVALACADWAVDNGVDIASLLQKVGIEVCLRHHWFCM